MNEIFFQVLFIFLAFYWAHILRIKILNGLIRFNSYLPENNKVLKLKSGNKQSDFFKRYRDNC